MKVLVTRPALQAQEFGAALEQAGFTPIYFPVIEVRPAIDLTGLDRALEKLACYDWIIFTSTNSVEIVFERQPLAAGWPNPAPRVAAVGPKTARALASHGVSADFIPAEYMADAILPGLGELANRWVLFPCAEVVGQFLPDTIVKSGGILHKITIYHTLPATPDPGGLAALRSGVNVVTFTSPSTVANFIQLASKAGLDLNGLPGNPRYVCIGPVTYKAAVEAGLPDPLVADEYTTEGILKVLQSLNQSGPDRTRLAHKPPQATAS